MNSKEWQNINDHMKNAFTNITEIKQLDTLKRIDNKSNYKKVSLKDNVTYSCPVAFLAVSISNHQQLIDQLDIDTYHVILKEYLYSVAKIMNIYYCSYIKVISNSIYCIFQTKTKDDIQNVVDCAIEINTFEQHLNKRIKKDIDEDITNLKLGIGIDYDKAALLSNNSINNVQDIFITSNALDNALELCKISNTTYELKNILITQMVKNNLTDQKTISWCEEVIINYNNTCYSLDAYFTKYQNWINNNA